MLIEKMQQSDFIVPSTSLQSFQVGLVKKKIGGTQFCIGYRKINDIPIRGSYPLPRNHDTVDSLSSFSSWTFKANTGKWN